MPTTLFTGVQIWMEIYLPKLFELMTEPDIVRILEWYVAPGDSVQPGANLLKVRAPGRTITIPTPPELVTPHRVVEIAKGEKLHLGDFLIKLEPETSSPSA
jgi:pyruvate/2-oxoglutarate dehydrogenase complex dihydrolipoamide acyltransferase (E2) component